MFRKVGAAAAALVLSLTLAACDPPTSDADSRQAQATKTLTDQADRTVGMPAIKNFTEKKMARDIYELRDDPNIATYAYVQGLDGKLRCLGRSLGYGLPYSTQFSNPEAYMQRSSGGYLTMPQAEPNGLFTPDGMSATWLNLIDPATGKPSVVYVEPTITVSPIKLTGPAVAGPC